MNVLESKDFAVVVVSCDDYSDLWDNFFTLKSRYFDLNSIPTYLVSNSKKYPDINSISVNLSWTKRLLKAVLEIPSKYILLLLEDYYFSSEVDLNNLYQLMEIMTSKDLNYVKLSNFSSMKTTKFIEHDFLNHIYTSNEYAISLQPSLWKREFLLSMISNLDGNAWSFEVALNDYIRTHISDKYIHNIAYDSREVLNLVHMVVQGKYLPSAVKKMRKLGVVSAKSYIIYKLKLKSKYILKGRARKKIKTFLKKIGIKFTT
jgi:hypothetical protein